MNCKCSAEHAVARNLGKEELHPAEELEPENPARFFSGSFNAHRSLSVQALELIQWLIKGCHSLHWFRGAQQGAVLCYTQKNE